MTVKKEYSNTPETEAYIDQNGQQKLSLKPKEQKESKQRELETQDGDRDSDGENNSDEQKQSQNFNQSSEGQNESPNNFSTNQEEEKYNNKQSGGSANGGTGYQKRYDRADRGDRRGGSYRERDAYENDYSNIRKEDVIEACILRSKSPHELIQLAEELNIGNVSGMLKQDIIFFILKQYADKGFIIKYEGVLEIMQDGFGFLRSQDENYMACPDDVYVPHHQVKGMLLRSGDKVTCYVRGPRRSERFFTLVKVISLNGDPVESVKHKINFDNLTPLYPDKQIKLAIEVDKAEDFSMRLVDLTCPIGFGQRALIVAPPRTGKTVFLKNIARSIAQNQPNAKLIVLLIDERPEEVTDMVRFVKGEVVSSTFDEPASRHVSLAEIVIEKAKRMVEHGDDVIILLDSITRLARAYNAVAPSSGKVLTGGVDSNALQRPKRFFGAARNIENGGSLTIIATALVETGSKMDEVIFEEFKGTGNSEIVLDRKLADKRVFPALDVIKSGTRNEEEMIEKDTLNKMWMLRRVLSQMSSNESMEFLLKKMKGTKNNAEFFSIMNSKDA